MYIRSSTPSQLYKESRRYFGSDLVLPKIQSHLYHSNILRHYCGILHLGLAIHILGFNTRLSPSQTPVALPDPPVSTIVSQEISDTALNYNKLSEDGPSISAAEWLEEEELEKEEDEDELDREVNDDLVDILHVSFDKMGIHPSDNWPWKWQHGILTHH